MPLVPAALEAEVDRSLVPSSKSGLVKEQESVSKKYLYLFINFTTWILIANLGQLYTVDISINIFSNLSDLVLLKHDRK